MYELNDTVVAVSSPTYDNRVIVRLSGAGVLDILGGVCCEKIQRQQGITKTGIIIDSQLTIDGEVYFFAGPHSYTGDDIAEICFCSNAAVTGAFLERLLGLGAKMAGPGEFTCRAYLNGKIDLAQAEAVNEIIVSSNRFQLQAAEKLLAGQFAKTLQTIAEEIFECVSLLEAGIDFSTEDIVFLTTEQAAERLVEINARLRLMLEYSIDSELLMELPTVGIAGAANAGKSSLLNALLCEKRSIVSAQAKTTRDILSGQVVLENTQCVIFDCAGLLENPEAIIDQLAQEAAIDGLKRASLVVFCVDISKEDFTEDVTIRGLVENAKMLYLATKCDLVDAESLAVRLVELERIFGSAFLPFSCKTGLNADELKKKIDHKLLEHILGQKISSPESIEGKSCLALNARHKRTVIEAVENINQAIEELQEDNNEIAVMLLRGAYESVGSIEQQDVEGKILEQIFANFCIGK